MRKLDKKNKTFIVALSALTIIVLVIMIGFIIVKIGKTTVKYDILSGSFVYNSSEELVSIKDKTYAKRNVFDNYYVVLNDEKINVGSKPVFYNERTRSLKLLGTFYEIAKNGEVKKYNGETTIDSVNTPRLFKIADRRYLVVASVIRTDDNSLHANDYLLVDIDKAGNAYLYNNSVNIKTFSDLVIVTDGFRFDVSREYLIIDKETIDLAKVNGSTNEHDRTIVEDGEGDGNGGNGNGNGAGEEENPATPTNEKLEPEIIEKYVSRKTTITGIETTDSEIKIDYVVYDPFNEYEEVYVNVYANGNLVGKYNLGLALTSLTISSLKAYTYYDLDFYYSYHDETGTLKTIKFDTAKIMTKKIKASLSLEKVSDSVVRYILIVEGGYRLDSASVEMYIDDKLVGTDEVNTAQAASNSGYKGSITYEGTGDFVTLKLTNCIYNGEAMDIESSYKYKF